MAKFIVLCLAVCAAAISNVEALTKDELMEIEAGLIAHVHECNKDFGISEDVLKAAKENKNVDDIDPCLIGCVFKKTQVINEKGMFDADKLEEVSKKYLKTDDDNAKFKEIVEDCSKVNEKDVSDGEEGCQRSTMLLACLTGHKEDLLSSRRR